MIVLDSHIWFWWVNGENQRLPSNWATLICWENPQYQG